MRTRLEAGTACMRTRLESLVLMQAVPAFIKFDYTNRIKRGGGANAGAQG